MKEIWMTMTTNLSVVGHRVVQILYLCINNNRYHCGATYVMGDHFPSESGIIIFYCILLFSFRENKI